MVRCVITWVLRRVLQTSSGMVMVAATAPAIAPEMMWDLRGEVNIRSINCYKISVARAGAWFFFPGPKSVFKLSSRISDTYRYRDTWYEQGKSVNCMSKVKKKAEYRVLT